MNIKDLPPAQVRRLHQRILTRIHRWSSEAGGGMFGVDLPTLAYYRPGLAKAYADVRAELKRLRQEALQELNCE